MEKALNILIVEDCQVMQSVIKKTLIMSGLPIARIEIANNGRQGLELTEKESFHLVMIDINMPEMNGLQMITMLKQNPHTAEIPILIVSADTQKEQSGLFQTEDIPFIRKPFLPEELKKKVISTVNAKNNNIELLN